MARIESLEWTAKNDQRTSSHNVRVDTRRNTFRMSNIVFLKMKTFLSNVCRAILFRTFDLLKAFLKINLAFLVASEIKTQKMLDNLMIFAYIIFRRN